jgi:hypothetical protein
MRKPSVTDCWPTSIGRWNATCALAMDPLQPLGT